MQLALRKTLLNMEKNIQQMLNAFFTRNLIKSYLVARVILPAKIAMSSIEHLDI